MDENEQQTLDYEYKRYLEIMRPYLGQLLDQDVIEICNSWIQRLSNCKENEKLLRNKYIFAMCYQLAKGILEEPFLEVPNSDELVPLKSTNSNESVNQSTEVEYLALELDNIDPKVIYNKQIFPTTEHPLCSPELEIDQSDELHTESSKSFIFNGNNTEWQDKQTLIYYQYPNILRGYKNIEIVNDNYKHRVNNLIIKLREIKKQNLMLYNEIATLREEAKIQHEMDISNDSILKIDNATSTMRAQDSNVTLNSLKVKLHEVQETRNSLIETISNLQDKIDNFDEMKRNEIEELRTQHRLEIIQIKTCVREETKANCDKIMEELKQQNEQLVKDIQIKNSEEIDNLTAKMDAIISEKDRLIHSQTIKDAEITQLNKNIEELKNNQYSIFSKFLSCPDNDFNSKYMKKNAEELEKRLNKMEKSKIKYCKSYEAKLANMQKEKYLAECSLQLQLVKQRVQIINETADEHQTELTTALDKLEDKYKDIVANVQATAVQRRIQDQIALESIMQTVCGIHNEGLHCNIAQGVYTDQLPNKAIRNQTRDVNQSCGNELPTVMKDDKVGSVVVGNNFGIESVVNGYCLNHEKFGELFERVCIPQRDTGDSSRKD